MLPKAHRELSMSVVDKRLLCIDDIGWGGDAEKEYMRYVLRGRFNAGRLTHTFLTTNLKLDPDNQFADKFGLDVWSRINSSMGCFPVAGNDTR